MTMPEQIWAVCHETQGSVMIGEWADSVRHIGGTEYARADIAAEAERKAWNAAIEAAAGVMQSRITEIGCKQTALTKHGLWRDQVMDTCAGEVYRQRDAILALRR